MQRILNYFPQLKDDQKDQIQSLLPLYRDWNSKINVISRKDIEHLYLRHVLHSLAIAKFIEFKAGATVLDLGTGGGFPGIPLAIVFPKVQFTLIDGTGKKIKVVEQVGKALGLNNLIALHTRAEELKGRRFDFVVSRAVAKLEKLLLWSRPLLKNKDQHALPNGLIALKGGDLKDELGNLSRGEYYECQAISEFFEEAFFREKQLVYIQR